MRAALYYPWIYLKGGAERALYELVTRSRHGWTVYTNHFDPHATFPEFEQLDVVRLPEISVRRNVRSVASAALTVALQTIDMSGHDRAVTFSEGLGNLVAMRLRIPTTCVCLTPLKVVYDDVTNQRFFDAPRGRHYRAALALYRTVDRQTWRHYDKVFCISETVRDRLLANRLVEEGRIEVLYPGVDHERFRPDGASEHLFLLPGRIMWQKNIELAIESWRFFKPHPSDSDYRLIIAGMVDAKSREYLELLRRSVAWRDDVEFVCSPSDETLHDLYRRARGVLFTAPSEDFGLVPLEAMACGKPVIAQRRGGPTETIIDGETGILTSDNPREFAAAMRRLAAMSPMRFSAMQDHARARAGAEFDWKYFVNRIDDHLDDHVDDHLKDQGARRGGWSTEAGRERAGMRNLRVGIDAWGLSGDATCTGMGQYTASLLKWIPLLAPVEVVAYGAPGEDRPTWLSSDVQWRVPRRAYTGRLTAITSRTWWLPTAASRDGVDVFHTPGLHVRPSSPPVPSARCPHVVTIHDVIPLSYYRSSLPARNRRYYSWNLRRALMADRTLTVSESAKTEIARYTGVSENSIDVVGSAVDFSPNHDRTSLREAGIDGEYILYAGSYEPRKDLMGMLLAFDRFRSAGGAYSLVAITERISGHASAVRASLASLACRDSVRLLHSVPDAMLRALYTHARAVVFPSLAEGLGLPAIQAAACGVPVVVSDLPALRETVGGIAVFARPGDSDSLLHALVRASTDGSAREVAARLGPGIAAKYSPESCVSDHARIYWSCHEGRHALA